MSKLAPYEKSAIMMKIVGWISVAAFILSLISVSLASLEHGELSAGLAIPVVFLVWAIFSLKVSGAVKKHQTWGRNAGIIYSLLLLPAFPIGSLAGIYILIGLTGWEEQKEKKDKEGQENGGNSS